MSVLDLGALRDADVDAIVIGGVAVKRAQGSTQDSADLERLPQD